MKRSLIATATTLALASIMLAGCGQSPATSALPSRVSQSQMRPATPMTQAPAYGNPAPVLGNNAAAGVGAVVLQLSSLGSGYQVQATREDVAEVEVKMTGAGLTQPLIKRMSKAELQTSTTVAFEGVPVGTYSIALAAFDTEGLNIGQKSTSVQVQADQETEVKLQLKLNPTLASGNVKFDFDIVDGDLITEPTPAPDEEEADEPEMDTEGMLDVEIVSMDTVRKLLLLKKLEVTLKITNTNTTEHLSGEVKVDFYKMKGLFNKEETLVETLTQEVENLAPGKSVTVTLTSSKSASDAEATVHTIASSATASSR
ncbi:MAG: hypothetical protein ACLGIN_08440 [Candidatus Sericytochromatia bacterium]